MLKPAMVIEIELYSDIQVAAWDKADRLSDAERQRVLKKLDEPPS